jgi:hypothetical protein
LRLHRGPKEAPLRNLKPADRSKKSNATMNITYDNVEVSTPFFHENNTAAMNSYEDPLEPVVTAETVDPEENTIVHVLQTSISQIIRMKEYHEMCACGTSCINTYGSIMCEAIMNKTTEEYEKLLKRKEIITQHIRPMGPWETENTDPVPWRWENRTAVPVEERGACLLYLPMTYRQAFEKHPLNKHPFDPIMFDPRVFNQHTIEQHMSLQTPLCFVHENDVVDNGTVMCLRAFGNECFYGNETMKAMLKFEGLYPPKIASETSWLIVFAFLVMIVVGVLTHKPK